MPNDGPGLSDELGDNATLAAADEYLRGERVNGADSLVAMLDDMGEHDFSITWAHDLTDEQRALIPPADRERFRRRHREANEHIAESARQSERSDAKTKEAPKTLPPAWPVHLDLEALAATVPQPPLMLLEDWGPAGYAWLFAGHGGMGKSGIALYLAVCMAAELPFFGVATKQRRVMYLSCEDREGVLHWRLDRICKHLGITLDMLAGKLVILDLVGHDAVLWERDPRTGATLTASFGQLEQRVRELGIQVLFVDGISDTYGGSGASKTQVKRYVNALVGLIPPDRGAVVLVGHIDKKSAKDGAGSEGYDGTTGWHNAVRARWYLYPETAAEDGGPQKTGDLILELQKSNLGRTDRAMRFRWDDSAHLFVGQEITGESAFDRKHREREERDGVVAAMRAVIAAGDFIPAAATGPRTAHHVLSARPEMPETLRSGTIGKRRFWRLIEQLRAMHIVFEGSIPRPGDRGHKVRVLTLQSESGVSGNA